MKNACAAACGAPSSAMPSAFPSSSSCDRCSIKPGARTAGYGTYNVPPGTWSEDGSLLLCTLYSLLNPKLELADLAQRFVRFLDHAYMTPSGQVFDVSSTTATAIGRLRSGVAPDESGSETDTDNGALSRLLPLVMRFPRESDSTLTMYAQRVTLLTHRHLRVQIGGRLLLRAGQGAARR